MTSIHLPYVNIALDVFALAVALIILSTCIGEFSIKRIGSKHFLAFQIWVVLALIADIVGWFGEGNPDLALMTMISNTVTACACRFAIICFMNYLVASLYSNSRTSVLVLNIFQVLCLLSVLFCIGNVFYGYVYFVSETGHYVHSEDVMMGVLYMLFPILAVISIVLMSILATSSAKLNRWAFFVYTLFPVAGLIADHMVHGLSLTCAGFTISVLAIYTSIYLNRQKELDRQRSALMLSQINPHFVYNTLSAIAALCDSSPKQAKALTIDFSQYLRRNIDTLTSEAMIPFDREMEHVECYLKIEKTRFRESLNVIYSIGCKDFVIPPLTVQPIVENAVKHGISKKAGGGTVKICTYEEENSYIIEVIDDGAGFDTENSEMHVGLQNVKSRIAARSRGNLTVKSTVGVGTRVRIDIPKKGNGK